MKSEKLLRAIGQIDDALIEEGYIRAPQPRDRTFSFRIAVAAVACAAIALSIGVFARRSSGDPSAPILGIIDTTDNTKEEQPTTVGEQPTTPSEQPTTAGEQPTTAEEDPTIPASQPTAAETQPPTTESSYFEPSGEPLPSWAMHATMQAQCSTEETEIAVTLNYGHIEYSFAEGDFFSSWMLQLTVYDSKSNTRILLKEFSVKQMVEDGGYVVKYICDENGRKIALDYAHTEIVMLPLSLFSEDTGRISIEITEVREDMPLGGGAGVWLYYTRTEDSILFTVENDDEMFLSGGCIR